MIFSRGNKVTVNHFLNKRVNPLAMYYPPKKDGWNNSILCDHYPYMVQVIHKRKINSKKSLYYKFLRAFKDVFVNEYLSEEGGIFNLPDVIIRASNLEKENIIATIELASDISNEEFTLSNFAVIHEISTKSVLEYVEKYFKNPVNLGALLLPYKLENLPFILNLDLSFDIISERLVSIVKQLYPKEYKKLEVQLQLQKKVYTYILDCINSNYSDYLTPVLWEKLNMKEKLLNQLEILDKNNSCINFIDRECNKDLQNIKKLFK